MCITNRSFKKLVGAATVAVILCAGVVSASELVQEWDCGKPVSTAYNAPPTADVKCRLFADGVFTVSGTGDMINYGVRSAAPWWNVFRDSIESVIIGAGVTSVGDNAFSLSTDRYRQGFLTSVTIGDDVKTIGDRAFSENYKLNSVTLGDSLKKIGNEAFLGCTLTSITIPEGVDSIMHRAFAGNGLTSITIPNSVTFMGVNVFSTNINMTSAIIGNGVTEIPNSTFAFNYSLRTVTIGSSVTSIGEWAFRGMRRLTSIVILNPTPPTVHANAFDDFSILSKLTSESVVTVYVPDESVELYREAAFWGDFAEIKPVSQHTSIRHSTARNRPVNGAQVSLRGQTLNVRVSNVSSSHNVRVLDLRGRQVATFRMGETGAATFSLARIPAGKYVVEVRDINRRVGTSSVVVR